MSSIAGFRAITVPRRKRTKKKKKKEKKPTRSQTQCYVLYYCIITIIVVVRARQGVWVIIFSRVFDVNTERNRRKTVSLGGAPPVMAARDL